MRIGDILLLVGLGLGTIGGVLLAYDAIFGAGAQFKFDVATNQLAILKRTRASNRHILSNLGGSYTDADRQRELDQEEERWGPEEAELTALVNEMPQKYRDKVSAVATRGVFLLIAAFALQFIGTAMLAFKHDAPPNPPQCPCSTSSSPAPPPPSPTTLVPRPDTGPIPPPDPAPLPLPSAPVKAPP
jgi:hypothetical protein